MMKRLLFFIVMLSCITVSAQKYPEFQDPSEWIPLEKSFNYVSTSITPRAGQLPEMYAAPIKFVSQKENDLFAAKVSIDFLKYGFNEKDEEMVLIEGTVNLSCCMNKPVKLQFINNEGYPIQFGSTDETGLFVFTSPNGKLMEFSNYRLKLNFDTIKIIDDQLNEKQVELHWITRPDAKEMKRLRKKALKEYKKEKEYIDELRNKNG